MRRRRASGWCGCVRRHPTSASASRARVLRMAARSRRTDFVTSLAAIRQPVVLPCGGAPRPRASSSRSRPTCASSSRGTRFVMPQVAAGALPALRRHAAPAALIGVERTLRALLLGEVDLGRQAVEWGLAAGSRHVPIARRSGSRRTLLERGPLSLRFAKEAVRRSLDLALDDGARFEHDLYVLLETTRDRAEGVLRFSASEIPNFAENRRSACRTSWERCTSARSAELK